MSTSERTYGWEDGRASTDQRPVHELAEPWDAIRRSMSSSKGCPVEPLVADWRIGIGARQVDDPIGTEVKDHQPVRVGEWTWTRIGRILLGERELLPPAEAWRGGKWRK